VTALENIASGMSASQPLTEAERAEKRATTRRASASLIALVASMAEKGGGKVAGISIDVASMRNAQAKATHLRLGANAARAILRRLTDDALSLSSVVAQDALSVLFSLEQQSKSEAGKHLAPDVARLRAAAKEGVTRRPKKPKGKPKNGDAQQGQQQNKQEQETASANPPAAPPGVTQH
jgi:hypothetical protein